MNRKMSLIIGTLAAAATHRMVGTTPVATFTVAGTLTETNQAGEPVQVPFFQACEAWGNDALRVLDMTPGVHLTVSGKPEMNAFPSRSQGAAAPAAPAAPPRPGQATAAAATGTTKLKKEIRVRADFVEEAFIAADTVTETNGSIRSLYGVNRSMLVGRLASDVHTFQTKGGTLVVGTVVVEDRVRKGGEWTTVSEFFDFKVWRGAADMVASGVKGQTISLLDATLLVDRKTEDDGTVTRRPVVQAAQAFLNVKRTKAPAQQVQAAQTADAGDAGEPGDAQVPATTAPQQEATAQPAPF